MLTFTKFWNQLVVRGLSPTHKLEAKRQYSKLMMDQKIQWFADIQAATDWRAERLINDFFNGKSINV